MSDKQTDQLKCRPRINRLRKSCPDERYGSRGRRERRTT